MEPLTVGQLRYLTENVPHNTPVVIPGYVIEHAGMWECTKWAAHPQGESRPPNVVMRLELTIERESE